MVSDEQYEAVENELQQLQQKFRMVISHASGGHLSDPKDIERSTNDISVEITKHVNRVWEHAQEVVTNKLTPAGNELKDKLWVLRCDSRDDKARRAAEDAIGMWNKATERK
jgi:hypothetical protein